MMNFGLPSHQMEWIVQACAGLPEIEEAVVFGSRAKGNFSKGSDVDLAVKGEYVSHETILKLSGKLNEELPLPYFFDVLHYEAIGSANLLEHIDRVGVVIYDLSGHRAGETGGEEEMDRRELLEQFKNTVRRAGVYQIKNDANGRAFVGASPDLRARRNRFEFERKNGTSMLSRGFREDWRRYGAGCFRFDVLEELDGDTPASEVRKALAAMERKWLDRVRPYGERGYNRPPLP